MTIRQVEPGTCLEVPDVPLATRRMGGLRAIVGRGGDRFDRGSFRGSRAHCPPAGVAMLQFEQTALVARPRPGVRRSPIRADGEPSLRCHYESGPPG